MTKRPADLDQALAGKASEFLRNLERVLPPSCGVVVVMYSQNEHGALDIATMTLNGPIEDAKEVLRTAIQLVADPSQVPRLEAHKRVEFDEPGNHACHLCPADAAVVCFGPDNRTWFACESHTLPTAVCPVDVWEERLQRRGVRS